MFSVLLFKAQKHAKLQAFEIFSIILSYGHFKATGAHVS